MQSSCKVILILYFLRKHFFRRGQKGAWWGIGSFPVLLGAVMTVKNNLELWVHPVQRQQQQLWSWLASLCQLWSLCAGEEIMKGAPESRQCRSAVPGLLWGRPRTQLSAGLAAPAPGLEGTQWACLRWGFLVSATWDQGSNASLFFFFVVVPLLSCVRLCDPVDCSMPSSSVLCYILEFAQFMSVELVMLSNHLILCHPLLLPSIFPNIRVFSNESAIHIRWPKVLELQHQSFRWRFRTYFL